MVMKSLPQTRWRRIKNIWAFLCASLLAINRILEPHVTHDTFNFKSRMYVAMQNEEMMKRMGGVEKAQSQTV